MWTRTLVTGTAALAALVIAAGCSNSSGNEQASSQSATTASATTTPSGEAHNQADAMFAMHMIPHHQQAIEMSDIVLAKQGIDPRVIELANQIKAAQGPEIEKMQGWLKQWGMPMPSGNMPMPSGNMPTPSGNMPMPSGNMPMPSGDMPGHGNMPGGNMPTTSGTPGMTGMMSGQDMAALQNAQGVEASKLFLTQMIAHHEGAITMGQNEIKDGQYPASIELAQSIVTSQQKEIETMKGILATL
ncbi:DUF305 domain-containing protein [Mycobacterium sp. MMS18-G62]